MKVFYTKPFQKDYKRLPPDVRKQTDRKLSIFLKNPRHPSLHTKKMGGTPHVWEMRVTKSYRITFQIAGEVYCLRRIGTHDILQSP